MKKIFTLAAACLALTVANAQLPKSDFLTGYTVGQTLEKGTYDDTAQGDANPIKINQWNRSGKADANNTSGASPVTVAPLTYEGYSESGKDVAVELLKLESGQGRTTIYSLSNNNNDFGAGTYYLAFMFNVSTAGSSNEFLAFDGNYTGNGQRARFGVKKVDDETYELGVGDSGAPSTFIAQKLNYNQTYLAVLKITIDGAGLGQCALFLNPTLASEPATADLTTNITGTALKSIRGITIRQRSTLAAHLGGFRFAANWADVIGQGPNIIVDSNNIEEATIYANGSSIVTSGAGSLNIINLAGAQLINASTNGQLDTDLGAGFYLVQFTNEAGETITRKVVIK